MSIRDRLIDLSRGDDLRGFWKLYFRRQRTENKLRRSILTFRMCRMAHRHGGYIGPGAEFEDVPSLPHGIHGVFISRYARIGSGCRIYQNVTIGEIDGKAPEIGRGCLIGANAVIIGGVKIGDNVKIGAGAVVSCDVPAGSTVVCQMPRIIVRG